MELMLAVAVLVAAGACADSEPSDSPATSAEGATDTTVGGGIAERGDRQGGDPLPEPVPATEPSQAVAGEVPPEVLQTVLEDAADLAGVAVVDVVTITAQEMMWNDGSLGCAVPGQVYTQATVAGYWVVVEAGGAAFDYRLTDRGVFRRCENPLGTPPGGGAPES